MLQITRAKQADYESIKNFYYKLIDAMADAQYKPGWKKDIYPAQEFLLTSIARGELYEAYLNDQLVSCMAVNHETNDSYKKISWSVDAQSAELLVIHALGVLPQFGGRGIAKQMVRYVIELAQAQKIKAVRLDVLDGNLPAEKAYLKLGFAYRGTLQMFYEDTGWTGFKLFEYLV